MGKEPVSNPKDIDPHRDPAADEEDRHLLLDLLYGELEGEAQSRAERRVREHGELAPELEGWEQVRSLMRELPEEEPPDAISVKLLHAAAAEVAKVGTPERSDHEEDQSLWGWLKRLFTPVMMYPGLAAATSMVLVAGVAGALYLSGRSVGVELKEMDTRAASAPVRQEEAAGSTETLAAAPDMDMKAGEGYGAEEQAPADDMEGSEAAGADVALGGLEQRSGYRSDGDEAQGLGRGGGGAASGAGGPGGLESERKDRELRKGARRSRAPETKKVAAKPGAKNEKADWLADGRSSSRQAPTGRLYEGGELDRAVGTEAPARSAGKAASADFAQPPPPSQSAPRQQAGGVAGGAAGNVASAPAPSEPAAAAEDEAPAAEEPAPAPSKTKAAKRRASSASSRDKDASREQNVRARVRSLYRKALSAAKNDDCATVTDIARQVRSLDGSFYDKTFMGNKLLRACFGSKKASKK